MSSKEIIEKALTLKPSEKFVLVETLLNSLDEPDEKLNSIWVDEAMKRLSGYRQGKIKGIPQEEIFSDL